MKNFERVPTWKKFKAFQNESDAKRQSNRLAIILNYSTRVEYEPTERKYWLYILEKIESKQINKTLEVALEKTK